MHCKLQPPKKKKKTRFSKTLITVLLNLDDCKNFTGKMSPVLLGFCRFRTSRFESDLKSQKSVIFAYGKSYHCMMIGWKIVCILYHIVTYIVRCCPGLYCSRQQHVGVPKYVSRLYPVTRKLDENCIHITTVFCKCNGLNTK